MCACGVHVYMCGVHVYMCGVHVYVVCMCMWCACVCGVHVHVVCMCMWCACVCGVHVYVVCMCMWCACVCGVYVYICVCEREREYSKAICQSRSISDHQSAEREQGSCRRNLWKYSKKFFDDEEDVGSIKPEFFDSAALPYFSEISTDPTLAFHNTTTLDETSSHPSSDMDCSEITREEMSSKIEKSRHSSSPSPLDQVFYYIPKRVFPSFLPNFYNHSWR